MKKNTKTVGRPILMEHPWGELANLVGGTFKLAERLGVSQPTIFRWSKGMYRVPAMTQKEVERLCKYYGIKFKT